ncbi:MAG: Holliday junction branch migration protein RuvA [Candidatus Staskawiczbacteria bacterium]|nr:Holliday junction branch migration protein RuvA [Candidatus Staskawiczbacteria bacterium]
MISFLEGKIILKRDKFVIVEVAGVGYKVFLSRQTLLTLPEIGSSIKVFTYQNVKEEALDLYGFLAYDGLEFFETLMDIRGVGPKSALDISDLGSLEKIKDRILTQDEKIFEGIPGIGSKKAMTIILELTGKIKMLGNKKDSADEGESALMQLGFSKTQAKEALAGVPSNIKNTEDRIKLALKNLGK